MNSLFAAIWDQFSDTTTSGFYNDISGRFYFNNAPQESVFPYCVCFSVDDINDLDFSDEHEDFLLQFNIFTQNSSHLEAGELLESLKTMFDNCSLTVTGWNHLEFKRNNVIPNNDFSQEPPIQGYSIDYDILLERLK